MARTARFVTLTCSVSPRSVPDAQQDIERRLDNYGATEILFSSSSGFLSVTFVLHGSYATDTGTATVQKNLLSTLREYRAQEPLMTSEPEPEEATA